MNYFIVANNIKYQPNNRLYHLYNKKYDKIIRMNASWSNKTTFDGITDIVYYRLCYNNIQNNKLIHRNRKCGIVGYDAINWCKTNESNSLIESIIDLSDEKFNFIAEPKYKISTGFAVAYEYSTKNIYDNIYLVGFTFSGNQIHNWTEEKKWCLQQKNILII